jgi:hypothetical protein
MAQIMICEVNALVRSHTNLRPCVLVDTAIALAGDGRADAVVDRECTKTLTLSLTKCTESIDGFTRLTNSDYQRIFVEWCVAITKLGGILNLNGYAGKALD